MVLKDSATEDVALQLYDAQLWLSKLVDTQLTDVTPVSISLIYLAGLLTAFSPCAMGLVPLTVAYLQNDGDSAASAMSAEVKANGRKMKSVLYALGLASALSAFGLAAATFGTMYGAGNLGSSSTLGDVVSSITGVLILVMGLNLLDIVKIDFPSLNLNDSVKQVDGNLRAFLVGATTAVVASPCSSPVLTSLLAMVAASGNPVLGTSMLFSYSLGYATPVVAIGAFSESVTSVANRKGLPVVNTVLASALVGYGTYSVLNSFYFALL